MVILTTSFFNKIVRSDLVIDKIVSLIDNYLHLSQSREHTRVESIAIEEDAVGLLQQLFLFFKISVDAAECSTAVIFFFYMSYVLQYLKYRFRRQTLFDISLLAQVNFLLANYFPKEFGPK